MNRDYVGMKCGQNILQGKTFFSCLWIHSTSVIVKCSFFFFFWGPPEGVTVVLTVQMKIFKYFFILHWCIMHFLLQFCCRDLRIPKTSEYMEHISLSLSRMPILLLIDDYRICYILYTQLFQSLGSIKIFKEVSI